MKRIYQILTILGIGCFAWSCNEHVFVDEPVSVGDDVPFAIVTNIPASQMTKSMVSGDENAITQMQMICFDAGGMYLGIRDAVHVSSAGTPQKGLIEGVVPNGTTRIHFIANRNLANPLPYTAGAPEKIVMTSEDLTTPYVEGKNKNAVVYWGYHRENDFDTMFEWLQAGLEDHTKANKVELIRDRARIKLEIAEGAMTGISKVEWLVHNGRDRGTIAPFDATKGNPWADYTGIGVAAEEGGERPVIATVPLTEYKNSGRYTLWTSESDNEDDHFDSSDEYQYVFDDSNEKTSDEDGRIKIIMKVTPTSGPVKYLVALLKTDEEQIPIIRNNTYIITVSSFAHDGYPTLQKAINGDEFANAAVEIDRSITTVNDDQYSLQVALESGTTTVVYNSVNTYTINFKFTNVSDHSNVTTDRTAFKISWEKGNQDGWVIDSDGVEYNDEEGKWDVPVYIGSVGDNNVFDDYLVIKHIESGLERFVHVYAIEKFEMPETPTFTKETGTFRESNTNWPVYKLSFTLPSNYATDLLPLEVKFATSTLDAFSDDTATARHGTFGVSVESTGTLTNSTTTTDWNYDAAKWGYWYTYSINEIPEDRVINIYFKDIRTKKDPRPTQVGLFLKIPNFGDITDYHRD